MPILENWALVQDPPNAYGAPECTKVRFSGEVYDHPSPRHWDGKRVITSSVVDYDANGETFITSSGSRYTLGDPCLTYEAQFPDARARLIARAHELFPFSSLDETMIERIPE